MASSVRSHSDHSHSHHHHDNTYLTSRDRRDAGVRITRLGLYVNFAMAVSKGVGGVYLNSQALVADGIHALTDLLSDFMTLATISIALKSPTVKYPNGFGKVESFGSLMVSGLLLAGGVFMCQHAGGALYHVFFMDGAHMAVDHAHGVMGHSHSHAAKDLIPNINAAWLAGASIIIKEYLYRATMKVARERKSAVLASNAVHHRVDSLTSIVALLAIGGAHVFTGAEWLDPVGGLLVSLMVIQAGLGNTVAAVYELVDAGIDAEVKSSVQAAAVKALDTCASKDLHLATGASIRAVQGIKAGQNYLVEVEVMAPADWTLSQLQVLENAVRAGVGSGVRGVRKVGIKFVSPDQQGESFMDEFVGADPIHGPPSGDSQKLTHDHDDSSHHKHSS